VGVNCRQVRPGPSPAAVPATSNRARRGRTPGVESYGSRIRDELLAIEQFDTLLEAQVLVGDWRIEYSTYPPHSALDMLTPVEFADRWRGSNQPQLS
jgi:transposase InsO family protein